LDVSTKSASTGAATKTIITIIKSPKFHVYVLFAVFSSSSIEIPIEITELGWTYRRYRHRSRQQPRPSLSSLNPPKSRVSVLFVGGWTHYSVFSSTAEATQTIIIIQNRLDVSTVSALKVAEYLPKQLLVTNSPTPPNPSTDHLLAKKTNHFPPKNFYKYNSANITYYSAESLIPPITYRQKEQITYLNQLRT
jgi:hypothetical protein